MRCALCVVRCTLCVVRCTLYVVRCALYIVRFAQMFYVLLCFVLLAITIISFCFLLCDYLHGDYVGPTLLALKRNRSRAQSFFLYLSVTCKTRYSALRLKLLRHRHSDRGFDIMQKRSVPMCTNARMHVCTINHALAVRNKAHHSPPHWFNMPGFVLQ